MIFACSVSGSVGSTDCRRLRVDDSSAQARQVGEFFHCSRTIEAVSSLILSCDKSVCVRRSRTPDQLHEHE